MEYPFYSTCEVRNGNLLKIHVSEIRVKRIHVNQEVSIVAKVLLPNLYTVEMWDKDLVNAPNLKVSWLWLVDPPQNQQDCTFFALCPD